MIMKVTIAPMRKPKPIRAARTPRPFATIVFVSRVRERDGFDEVFRGYRRGLGRAILLGLEFLVAADIVRTVAVSPSFRGAGVLAIIVAVRTFLSFTLDVELDGRWPWQSRRAGG